MTDWGDVIARARGLSTHLLSVAQLAQLDACADLPEFAALAARFGAVEPVADARSAEPHALEVSARRNAAQRLAVLAQWARERVDALAPLFDAEDRRAVRALARGAVAGVPGPQRMAGLVPTPLLPGRALEELSRAGDLATIGALLVAWQHPFGAVVRDEGARQHTDLFRLEVALARSAGERARTRASRADAAMRDYVERMIDLENLAATLVLVDHRTDASPASVFVDGGHHIHLADLQFAAESASLDAVVNRLTPRLRGAPTMRAALLADARHAEDAALAAMIDEFRRRAISEPTGLATVIAFSLRLRADLQAVQRIVWRITLGVPRQPASPPPEAVFA